MRLGLRRTELPSSRSQACYLDRPDQGALRGFVPRARRDQAVTSAASINGPISRNEWRVGREASSHARLTAAGSGWASIV